MKKEIQEFNKIPWVDWRKGDRRAEE